MPWRKKKSLSGSSPRRDATAAVTDPKPADAARDHPRGMGPSLVRIFGRLPQGSTEFLPQTDADSVPDRKKRTNETKRD
jgi:hypothetical protein